MKINKRQLRKTIHQDHKNLQLVQAVVDALPDELPGNPYVHVGHWAAYIDIPYDWELYKAIRRALGGDWHSYAVHDQEDTGQKFYVLSLHGEYGKTLYVSLVPTKDGPNCRVEKVGERTTDIFEVVCD